MSESRKDILDALSEIKQILTTQNNLIIENSHLLKENNTYLRKINVATSYLDYRR